MCIRDRAKGQSFTAAELLGDAEAAKPFADGLFATVYLSPRDYHRVHMPWAGTLRETVHVPGRLFSVGTDAVASVRRLFARNERLVCHFDTDFGPMCLVMGGALLVLSLIHIFAPARRHAVGHDGDARADRVAGLAQRVHVGLERRHLGCLLYTSRCV